MRTVSVLAFLATLFLFSGCGEKSTPTDAKASAATASSTSTATSTTPPTRAAGDGPPALPEGTAFESTASGLKYAKIKSGGGAGPSAGQTVEVHYTGWLESNGARFDSSVDRGKAFSFVLGEGQVIKGWDEGVALMKVGEKYRLVIPAALGYGTRGAGGVIPPNATLVFDVELLGIR